MNHPDLDEVRRYCEERRNAVDAEQWYDHYEAVGWKVGRNPMKDWRAAVRTWERQDFNGKPKFKAQTINCRICYDSGMNDRQPCSCARGDQARQAREVMSRIRQMPSQLRFP
jgi:hypothetical protein